MLLKQFLIPLFFLFGISLQMNSQSIKVVQDLRQRTNLAIEKEVMKKLTFYAEGAIEFEKNISQVGKYFAAGGFVFKPIKYFDGGIEYRHTWNRKSFKDEYKKVNRLAIDVEGKYKIARLQVAYRLRYQTLDDDFYLYETDKPTENIIRNRLKLKYNLRGTKISPIFSSELYLQADNKLLPSQLKTRVGGEYKVKKLGKVALYYKAENELNNPAPYFFSTIELNFTVSL